MNTEISNRFHKSITPQEIRTLEAARNRGEQLSTRLRNERDQLERLKKQVIEMTTRIAKQHDDILRAQQMEDELKLHFIESKLQYEYEFKKKQRGEQELKLLRKQLKEEYVCL